MLYVLLPLEREVLLEYVQEADHLWEDEDPVPLLAEARQQLVQQHQLTRPVDQLLQPLSLRSYIIKFTCLQINQSKGITKINQWVTRKCLFILSGSSYTYFDAATGTLLFSLRDSNEIFIVQKDRFRIFARITLGSQRIWWRRNSGSQKVRRSRSRELEP